MILSKARRVYNPKIKLFLLCIIGIGVVVFLAHLITWFSGVMKQTGLTPSTIMSLAVDGGANLKSTQGRTNILLLGIGGGTHDGADLTDTILVISMDLSTHKTALISLPRDIWIDELKDKINSAYHYGEEKKKDGGLILAKATVEDVVGIPIHYGFLIDFSGFRKVIDLLGGIQVYVSESFTDDMYPIEGKENDLCQGDIEYKCRYQTVTFTKGYEFMNGERALIYVRSRHAQGDQGTDFARGKRQQDVILALRSKIQEKETWLNLTKVSSLLQAYKDSTQTDLKASEMITLVKNFSTTASSGMTRISIEDELVNPPESEYGRYVLIPKTNYEDIHEYIQDKLLHPYSSSSPTPISR